MTTESAPQQIAAINKKLETLAGRLARPTIANQAASIKMYGLVITNFDQEGAMYGMWAPLQDRTVAQKKKLGKEKMLVRSGHLRAGWVHSYDEHNAYVRNEVEYAIAHQEGVPEKNLPARNMVPPRSAIIDVGLRVYGYYVGLWTKEANA